MEEKSDTPRMDAATGQMVRVPMKFINKIAREIDEARAEVKRLQIALRNLLVMLPSELSAPDVVESACIPVGFCYVRWVDIKEGYAALAATEVKP